MPSHRLGLLVVAAAMVATASASATAGVRNKLAREYNASVANCRSGTAGVIVELVPAPNGGRRLGGVTRAEAYLEKLRDYARQTRSRALTESLLIVHGTFSTLLDGFSATLDDAMLDTILNDTEEVLVVEADW